MSGIDEHMEFGHSEGICSYTEEASRNPARDAEEVMGLRLGGWSRVRSSSGALLTRTPDAAEKK